MVSKDLSGFELIVHIGTGKTGSSSIQKTLSASQPILNAHGVAYLGLMCEESPARIYDWQKAGGWPELLSGDRSLVGEKLLEVLLATIGLLRRGGMKRAVWSNESIFGNDKYIIPILQELKSRGVGVKVIAYIRRHDAWARSAYLQWGIKHKTYPGPIKPFKDWYKDQKINFAGGLRPWLDEEWADIAVRNFDACEDVVKDFLAYYDLDEDEIVVRRDNETPNPVALALWTLFNTQIDEPVLPVQLQRVMRQAGVLAKAPVDCDIASLLPSQRDVFKVWEDCAQDRDKIDAIFAQFEQPPMEKTELRNREFNVTQNQINAALLMMIKQQADQITSLTNQIKVFKKNCSEAEN